VNFLQFSEELSRFSKSGKGFKPHKYLLLLSVLKLVRDGKISTIESTSTNSLGSSSKS